MKRGFTRDEARLIYKYLPTETTEDVGSILAVYSCGGAVNRPEFADLTPCPDAGPTHKGPPYHNQQYEGCYTNYPDSNMLASPFWPHLYYGEQGLYPFLQRAKRRYEPDNIFHHAMSIRA
ncbi:hypothetical protein FTO74_05685 [Granulicella sp. WH15]|uniref:BBE domain-containing protein n=1 Tax=Granulicella sp. WH15 TaxID=2602070 RepID=UPI001366B91B|nr:BBE domain-containing protein [Granulicella sp. WH15]QHN02918.1 hypothetical protein FTO74_05685 [Granulicella sp. WH15]